MDWSDKLRVSAYTGAQLMEAWAEQRPFSPAYQSDRHCRVCGSKLHSHGTKQIDPARECDSLYHLLCLIEEIENRSTSECLEADCKTVREWFHLSATYYDDDIDGYGSRQLTRSQSQKSSARWMKLVKAIKTGSRKKEQDLSDVYPLVMAEMLRQMGDKSCAMPPDPPAAFKGPIRWNTIWHMTNDEGRTLCNTKIPKSRTKELGAANQEVNCKKCLWHMGLRSTHPSHDDRSSLIAQGQHPGNTD
ncbi:MAG: hypothetical protein R3F02_18500 [Thiolinea sp.]